MFLWNLKRVYSPEEQEQRAAKALSLNGDSDYNYNYDYNYILLSAACVTYQTNIKGKAIRLDLQKRKSGEYKISEKGNNRM